MPIRPEQRALYPKDWAAISLRVRERAGQRCEQCRAPNGQQVARAADRYMLEDGQVFHAETGEFLGHERGSEFPALRFTKIVLTVAHLDHDPRNNDDTNLRALCQRCHLAYDRDLHRENARRTRERKRRQGRLFS